MEQLLNRITLDPSINHGKPTIRNMRYPVEEILSYLAAGDSMDDLLFQLKTFIVKISLPALHMQFKFRK